MSEVMKDSAIKLFGKTIGMLPDKAVSDIETVPEQRQCSSSTSTSPDSKDVSGGEITGSQNEDDFINPTEETLSEPATSSEISDDDPDTPDPEKDSSSPKTPKKDEPSESSDSQEKTLKKPDKVLPCPRCNSRETKFCYYNNYNVNQPRHFCKHCQRYWTSGGTMRNVPVGSGRRKNKNVMIQNYNHMMISDALQTSRSDGINGIHLSSLKPDGFIIFGSNKVEERQQNCVTNELYEHSSGASTTTSNSTERGGQSFQDVLWPCPWNSGQLRSPKPPPVFGPSGFPVTFYPATPYWESTLQSPSMLGKHSREGTMIGPSNLGKENVSEKISLQKPVLIPKTLRIDDPNEAAKSSIWSTLGIKNEKNGSINGTGLFRTIESKGDRNSSNDNTIMVLQANPAAFSRSLNFQESA